MLGEDAGIDRRKTDGKSFVLDGSQTPNLSLTLCSVQTLCPDLLLGVLLSSPVPTMLPPGPHCQPVYPYVRPSLRIHACRLQNAKVCSTLQLWLWGFCLNSSCVWLAPKPLFFKGGVLGTSGCSRTLYELQISQLQLPSVEVTSKQYSRSPWCWRSSRWFHAVSRSSYTPNSSHQSSTKCHFLPHVFPLYPVLKLQPLWRPAR